MEHIKVLNLLNKGDSKFVSRNWNIVNDQFDLNYSVGNEFIYSKEVLKSNCSDYNDASITVRDNITTIGQNVTQVVSKNYTPLIKCITKMDRTTIDDI